MSVKTPCGISIMLVLLGSEDAEIQEAMRMEAPGQTQREKKGALMGGGAQQQAGAGRKRLLPSSTLGAQSCHQVVTKDLGFPSLPRRSSIQGSQV